MTRARLRWSPLILVSALALPAVAIGQQEQAGDQNQAQQAGQQNQAQQAGQQNQAQQADQQNQAQQAGQQNQAQQAGRQSDATGPATEEGQANGDQAKKLKIFELEHITPREVSELLRRYGGQTTLVGQQSSVVAGANAAQGAAGAAAQNEQVRIASDDDKKLLFVRGPQKKIDEIGKVIDAFDVPADQLERQQFRDAHLVPIPKDDAGRIGNILRELEIQSSIWSVGEARVLVFREGSDSEQAKAQMEQAEQIIAKLTERKESEEENAESEQQSGSDEGAEEREAEEDSNGDN